MAHKTLAVSAPGKVLFTGGFLVLDRKHTGLVLGLDARIHAHITQVDSLVPESTTPHVLVRSPQFLNASWLYRLDEGALDKSSFITQVTE